MATSNFYTKSLKVTSCDSSFKQSKPKMPKAPTAKTSKSRKPLKEEETEGNDEEQNQDQNQQKPEKKDISADSIKSLKDLVGKTKTKIKITKVGSEPWGFDDTTDNHNKFKITLTNENGSIWYIFWESKENTKKGKTPSEDEVISEIGHDASIGESIASYEDFKKQYGFDGVDEKRSRKAYAGFKKAYGQIKKMFPGELFDKFVELSNN